ncbi:GH12 family glycosyl hydrolase domain-containing protein [Nonomuraea soli]|uniref:Chitodextrinase n=1 Tax=Nonomuraea soli TaxID=1032476 RepID=A0A7W0CI01_9ACTN|nr:cellulose binding domain-containing protein [Nonomuraea soli]MBA2891514.1 chitodextrinase [Nonomuraea soli]
MRVLIGLLLALGFLAAPAEAAPVICEKYGSTSIQNGRYIVQNNVWGADTAQCIDVNQNGGFTVTQAQHNNPTNGAPAGYPSIFAGCHYANCTTGSSLPMRASDSRFGTIRTGLTYGYPSGGTYNAAYDLWFDPTPRTDGQNTGAEIMIWLNRQGSIQPIGSRVGTATLAGATWEVWFGNIGWNVVSYVRTSTATSIEFAVDAFYSDAVNRGHAQRSWYLTSVQAGFEPWVGVAGLSVSNFSYTIGSGPTDPTPPTAPANLAASGTTSTSTNLSWSASTDNVGVTRYEILRNGTQVGTSTTTGFTASGLTPSTAYQFQVRARDAAGNVSSPSNTVSVTTQSGGGNGGCTATASVQSQWQNGYVVQVNVRNTGSSTINGWTVGFTLPSGHTITGSWNAVLSGSTARNVAHNGTVAPDGSTSFGFQASRPNGDTSLPSGFTCS